MTTETTKPSDTLVDRVTILKAVLNANKALIALDDPRLQSLQGQVYKTMPVLHRTIGGLEREIAKAGIGKGKK